RGLGDVGKSAIAIVVEEMALADSGNENVVEAVVVVVADGDSESEERNAEAGLARHVGEGAVMIVVVELQRGRAVFGMAGPVLAVDEQDVGKPVVVVIDERAAGAHGFREPFLSEGSVVVREVDAGLGGDVAEGNLCRRDDCRCWQKRQHPPQRNRGTEEGWQNILLERVYHLWAPEVVVVRAAPGLCPAGRTNASVLAWFVATLVRMRFAGTLFKIGSGTDTCSWILCRS